MLSDYFITIRDIKSLIRHIIRRTTTFTIIGELVVVFAAAIAFFVFHWPIEPIFFTVLAIILIYWNVDGRLSIGFGLACLALIIVMQLVIDILISLPLQLWSEQLAVWAYYFLAIGVIKQIIELVFDRKRDQHEPK